jgi:hypothetical protein
MPAEQKHIGPSGYLVQRFGYSTTAQGRISLTFDDRQGHVIGAAYESESVLRMFRAGMARKVIPSPMSAMCSHLPNAEHLRWPLWAPSIGRGAP